MNSLVDRIAAGKATLLGIDDICTRIGVSRTTFDRWVRNGSGKGGLLSGVKTMAASIETSLGIGEGLGAFTRMTDQAENFTDGGISFPPPDIRIGNSPKWELETFKRWLQSNVTADAG